MSTSEEEGDDYLSGEVAKGDAQEDGEGDEEYARRLDRMMNAPRAKRKSGAPSAAQRHLQRKRASGRRARSVLYAESDEDDDDDSSEEAAEDDQEDADDGDGGGASLSGDLIEDDDGDSEGGSSGDRAAGNRSGRAQGLAGARGGHRGDPLQPPMFFEQGPDFSDEVIERRPSCHSRISTSEPHGLLLPPLRAPHALLSLWPLPLNFTSTHTRPLSLSLSHAP